MKWLWRFSVEDDALCRKVVKMKYGQMNKWISMMVPPPRGVRVWRNVRALWPSFSQNTAGKATVGTSFSEEI